MYPIERIKVSKEYPNARIVTYTLISSAKEERESYSVEICMLRGEEREVTIAEDVSSNGEASERLLYLLASADAEPCHLYDILEDLLPL